MIKDPLNSEETPYDILEIDVDTPSKDIHQALPRFMKKNKAVSKIAMAQDAIRKLKNIKERMTFDITYYSIDILESPSFDSLCDISGLIVAQINIPISDPSDFFTDLYSNPDSIELPKLNFHMIDINDIKDYHDQNMIQLLMSFDKIEPCQNP